MKNNFDHVAPVYDNLKHLAFGRSIRAAEQEHLHLTLDGGKVLVLGGGTGQVIEDIYAVRAKVELTYIETSFQMMQKAMLREASITHRQYINFVQKPFEQFNDKDCYDVVIAHFFLDVFTQTNLAKMVQRIKKHLKPNGVLLVADFRYSTSWYMKIWQVPLLSCMHLFFKLMSNMENDTLHDIHDALQKGGFNEERKNLFYRGFIFSSAYSLSEEVDD